MIPGLSSIYEFMRSLSFGGLLFIGLGTLLYVHFPEYFGGFNHVWFILGCGAIGGALQQGIAKVMNFFLGPIGRLLVFYENLLEITALETQGAIDEKAKRELVQKLCEKRFITNSLL